MARKTLRQELVEDHRKQTKNFSGFMSVLYGTTTILLSTFLVILFSIAYINPLWFRQNVLDFVADNVPVFFRKLQDLLFESYRNKVNLFETIKTN